MDFKKTKKGRGLAGVLILLLGFCLLQGGCESDSVAPNDDLPQLTEREAAQRVALVATGISKVGPQVLSFNGKKSRDKDDVVGVYPYDFPEGGDITGSIVLEYFFGGAGGTHVHWDDADYGLLYTPKGVTVSVALDLGGGVGPIFGLTFDLHGDIDRAEDTAEVAGSGTFSTGGSSNGFTIPDTDPIVLTGVSSYPTGGEILFSADGFNLSVEYEGDHIVDVTIGDVVSYTIDLNTGIVTPVEE
jgi:hypothetical protein